MSISEDLSVKSGINGSTPIFVTARMSSSRLPGKALLKFGRKPLLSYVVDAALAAQGTGTVLVATSDEPSDDPIADWCITNRIDVWRGSLEDVAGRLLSAAKHLNAESFVRISGDSPMLDPRIVSFAVRQYAKTKADLVTNVHPRTFPAGQSVEVVRSETLERVLSREETSLEDREHVTPALYRYESGIRIERFAPADLGSSNGIAGAPYKSLTVDSTADARCFRHIIQNVGDTRIWTLGWERFEQMMRAAESELCETCEDSYA